VGARRDPVPPIDIPVLSELPVIGRLFFEQDLFVYGSIALTVLVAFYLNRTRSGLMLRSIGENHASAHGLGLPVWRVRFLAILFGGACAGLAGTYLALVYTRFWSPGMTAGRGWIALALVVFASWLPARLLIGAYLFGAISIGQLHLQAVRSDLPDWLELPSQVWTALPYLATIAVLVVISASKARGGAAPASLGMPFVPDR